MARNASSSEKPMDKREGAGSLDLDLQEEPVEITKPASSIPIIKKSTSSVGRIQKEVEEIRFAFFPIILQLHFSKTASI